MSEVKVRDITGPARNTERASDNTSASRKPKSNSEVDGTILLNRLSTELSQETGTAGSYQKIVEAAIAIMGSQYASMQMLYPEPGSSGKLHMVACSGFSPEAEKYWEWVYHYTDSSCGEVLRTRRRVIVPDYRACEFMRNSPTLPVFIEGGIFAAQSTPLYSKTGGLLGMISTHWNAPHTPSQHDLDLLDLLAQQAADLMERTQAVVETPAKGIS